MGVKNSRQYTVEFKLQAVQLAQELKSGPKAAAQLGIPASNIHTWRTQVKAGTLGSGSSPATAVIPQPHPSMADEVRRLQREVAELKKVNQILKQAAAFFSQDHLK